MDPERALIDIRNAQDRIESMTPPYDVQALAEVADELCEAFHSLDEWLSKGGFLPRDWSR